MKRMIIALGLVLVGCSSGPAAVVTSDDGGSLCGSVGDACCASFQTGGTDGPGFYCTDGLDCAGIPDGGATHADHGYCEQHM